MIFCRLEESRTSLERVIVTFQGLWHTIWAASLGMTVRLRITKGSSSTWRLMRTTIPVTTLTSRLDPEPSWSQSLTMMVRLTFQQNLQNRESALRSSGAICSGLPGDSGRVFRMYLLWGCWDNQLLLFLWQRTTRKLWVKFGKKEIFESSIPPSGNLPLAIDRFTFSLGQHVLRIVAADSGGSTSTFTYTFEGKSAPGKVWQQLLGRGISSWLFAVGHLNVLCYIGD